jgi:hypothetical protein
MRTIALCAAILALAAPAAAATSGLRGVVARWPVTPVCRAGVPCSAPAKGVTLTFRRLARSWSAKTDDRGRYRIHLRPGTYTVTVSTQRPGLPAWKVVVPRGRVAVHNFLIDTGIR